MLAETSNDWDTGGNAAIYLSSGNASNYEGHIRHIPSASNGMCIYSFYGNFL